MKEIFNLICWSHLQGFKHLILTSQNFSNNNLGFYMLLFKPLFVLQSILTAIWILNLMNLELYDETEYIKLILFDLTEIIVWHIKCLPHLVSKKFRFLWKEEEHWYEMTYAKYRLHLKPQPYEPWIKWLDWLIACCNMMDLLKLFWHTLLCLVMGHLLD